MTTRIVTQFVYPPIPIRSLDWCATFDDYDGAPDAGHQCMGHGATELQAVCDLYDDYEGWFGEGEGEYPTNPLCARRPMFEEDLGLHDLVTLMDNYIAISVREQCVHN